MRGPWRCEKSGLDGTRNQIGPRLSPGPNYDEHNGNENDEYDREDERIELVRRQILALRRRVRVKPADIRLIQCSAKHFQIGGMAKEGRAVRIIAEGKGIVRGRV